MKKIGILVCSCLLILISISLFGMNNDTLNAASNYTTGNKVFIGDDSYTIIDSNTMTLLKDTATDAGEVTWDNAVASLTGLADNYGELGSKLVTGKFTLPKSTDLSAITNTDHTALINIDPLATDWWLGDESVDNRSRFVGGNTNSLVTELTNIKNVLDTENHVCNTNQTVTEQGLKPTKTGNDPTKKDTYESDEPTLRLRPSKNTKVFTYSYTTTCSMNAASSTILAHNVVLDGERLPSAQITNVQFANFLFYLALTRYGMDDYLMAYAKNPSLGYNKVFSIPSASNVCYALDSPSVNDIQSYKVEDGPITIQAEYVTNSKTVSCAGHAQTAGTSSVRPLLTIDKSKIAYTSSAKPNFSISSNLNQSVPVVDGKNSYLTITDADLGIALDSANPNVNGTVLTVDRNNSLITIPVSLSGTTSGDRYVSAVATTNSGERYGVLGLVEGTSGNVQLDIANLPTSKKVNLTLYQEVDEGTNTIYRGTGTTITLDMTTPISAITFTPNYPNGKTSWTEGDFGIDAAGAKTGSLTFSGGTSGINDPTSGKDYQKWEIVDASGNPTSDANFSITNNELIANKRIAAGTYNLNIKVTDNENEMFTDTITITVVGHPAPTLEFTPSSSTLTYGDHPTKVNNITGTFSLKYPDGEPTSTIKTIQLGIGGDESHFSIDTTGALKVKGNDLDAGTYSVTVSGTDGNDMTFTKTVSITVNKKDQNNYQITNSANYPLQVNQEINITTSGNESGENETYTITNGSNVAQINGNKFKLLSSGTFTLQATVGGNTNYNSKTVTKQITVSQLPTQNPPVSITSSDSMMYGDTYTPTYSGGQGSGAVSWSIENDNGTGAVLNNGSVKVTGVGTFTLKVTKAGTSSYQESTATKVITVNKRKTNVKPKDVTKTVGQAFKDNGATYTPQPISGDNLGTLTITSKYPDNQAAGRYTDGIQASGLSNPNYEFEYQEGTLIINSNSLPNNGDGYYKVTGTKGKNNWYISDVQISTTNKNGYDEISKDGLNFQTNPLIYSTDGDYPTEFYLKNSSTGIIAKAIQYQLKIDQTPPDVPSLSMKEINKNAIARFINALSFGNWMNQGVQVTMTSTDGTSGIDHYEYTETSQSGANTKTSTNGIVTYNNDVELTVKAKACDKAGNCSALSNDESIMIDTKAPTITGVKDKSEYKHYYLPRFVNVKDSYSGLSYSEYKKDGNLAGTIQNNVDEQIGEVGEYEVYAIDNAGNEITISFKIVPLPDIETEIDGSDESKEIIDQVIKELEEIKDKIDETEKKDIEDWIKDALEKWESSRKKVLETNDKSAKVEGQGDTDFDPNVVLVVDDITEQANIPSLPKRAIVVYDVYLQKGNIRTQPDGSIKVYLPYVETSTTIGYAMGGANGDSVSELIVYQIDTNNRVTQINVQREGNYITFITDELMRYAISNDKQDLNKDDDTCVVGPDGNKNSGDEVCGLPSDDGKQPEKQPDGSVKVPDGGKVEFPNGKEIDTPDGAIIHPDGSVTLPDGTEYDPNGNKKPNQKCPLEGIEINIDSDEDGKPDVNIDIDGDCKADLNIDTDGDGQPNTNIDTDLDGKPDYNIDTDNDGKPDVNIGPVNEPFKPTVCKTVNSLEYCSDPYKKPYLNIDSDGDGRPDINVDLDGDMEADINIDIDGDNIPDLDIDSDGDGKPDINIDTDKDGKADKNIVKLTEWKPDKNVDGSIKYDTMSVLMSLLNGNDDNDSNRLNKQIGGAIASTNTGDSTKPFLWWIVVIINLIMMIYCFIKVKKEKEEDY